MLQLSPDADLLLRYAGTNSAAEHPAVHLAEVAGKPDEDFRLPVHVVMLSHHMSGHIESIARDKKLELHVPSGYEDLHNQLAFLASVAGDKEHVCVTSRLVRVRHVQNVGIPEQKIRKTVSANKILRGQISNLESFHVDRLGDKWRVSGESRSVEFCATGKNLGSVIAEAFAKLDFERDRNRITKNHIAEMLVRTGNASRLAKTGSTK